MSRSPWAWPPEAVETACQLRGTAAHNDPASPLGRAIKAIGTMQALADAVGISIQAVSQWKRVPPLRVLEVERITGIPRHELRPDIYPPPATPAPSPSDAEARP